MSGQVIQALEKYYQGWAHSPLHRYHPGAMMVTAATYQKELYFKGPERLTMLQAELFEQARKYGWKLQAWAVMANHYHFIALAPEQDNLKDMTRELHSRTARLVNSLDGTPGRKVWFQYHESELRDPKSYYARLNYTLHNPEKHKLVENAMDYRWCSMWWFMVAAEPAFKKTVFSFKYDRVSVEDDY